MYFLSDETVRRLKMFGLLGIVGTAAHYAVLVGLVEALNFKPVIATTLGFTVGAAVNYILNYRYTFKSKKAHSDTAPKFYLIAVLTGFLNAILVFIGVHSLNFNYLIVQILVTAVVFLTNFILNSRWTFLDHGHS
jgi:putative flippase GtrA